MATTDSRPVVIFDGVCNLCNRSIDFIVRRDREGLFAIAPNEGEAARALLGDDAADASTIVLVEDGQRYERSTAVLRIARRLPMPWKLAYAGIVIPRPVRDLAYQLLAKNRYRWFGRRDSCRLPTPEEAARFLD